MPNISILCVESEAFQVGSVEHNMRFKHVQGVLDYKELLSVFFDDLSPLNFIITKLHCAVFVRSPYTRMISGDIFISNLM